MLAHDATSEVTQPTKSSVSLNLLIREVTDGSLWASIPRVSPPWGVNEVISISLYGFSLGLLLTLGQILILQHTSSFNLGLQPTSLTAITHLGQEIVLDAAIVSLLYLCLRRTDPREKGFFQFLISRDWISSCVGLAFLTFPLMDPLFYSMYTSLLHTITPWEGGGLADGAYKSILDECKAEGDTLALSSHFLASCLFGPFWEELFWRGFILPSIISRIPRSQANVGILVSSAVFSSLHLSLSAWPVIFAISSLCDVVALRSSSLFPPLLIHAFFNAYEFLGVLIFGKDFV